MEKFDKRVVQAFIDGRPDGVDPKQHRPAGEAYVHVGYDEEEATALLRRVVPEMPSADACNAMKTAVPICDSLSRALSRTTSMAETLGKVNAALVEVGQPNAMAILGSEPAKLSASKTSTGTTCATPGQAGMSSVARR
ncbi:hypothetical protein [Burkholderia multivorans]|uniref:hypothetical protein n=1 Tax=Burkholderia multivorans TaxID=87883 RepID=UPI0012D9952C|nr:hypothetical protein [Burkholderia multivorans]